MGSPDGENKVTHKRIRDCKTEPTECAEKKRKHLARKKPKSFILIQMCSEADFSYSLYRDSVVYTTPLSESSSHCKCWPGPYEIWETIFIQRVWSDVSYDDPYFQRDQVNEPDLPLFSRIICGFFNGKWFRPTRSTRELSKIESVRWRWSAARKQAMFIRSDCDKTLGMCRLFSQSDLLDR